MSSTTDPAAKKFANSSRVVKLSVTGVLALIVVLVVVAVTKASTATKVANLTGGGLITTSPLIGQNAPLFSLPDLHDPNKQVSLSSFSGKPTVINFFSPACVPCREEMPTFAKLGATYKGKINFIGVDETSTASVARSFVDSFHLPYTTVIDANGALIGTYLLPGVPVTVFVGSDGVVKGYVAGAITKSELIARTSSL
ncbi:MAG: TlpA disulfide reductase family protein [Actinomycetota bacterium]|nr:TlpA disulfide reductase family protein [Actinomycetota bacterium]